MRGIVRLALFIGLGLLLLLGAVTWLALEAREVVVLHTRTADGAGRATRVWVADEDGFLWLEAPTARRAWYRDLVGSPTVELERSGRRESYEGHPLPGPEGQARVRRLFRRKYGLADWWVTRIQDTSHSIAVRLERVD